jgi:hypothetical protein
MMKTLLVGMFFLGSLNASAQPGVGGIETLVKMAATKSGTTPAVITGNLLRQVEGSTTALAQTVKNDPLYIFTGGKLNETSLQYLGKEAQGALVQMGRGTAFKSIATTAEYNSQYAFSTSLTRAAENTPLSANGQVKVALDPVKVREAAEEKANLLIEDEVRAIGLSDNVATELTTELQTFRSQTGVSYTNRGMCQGLNDEAAQNFTQFLKSTRENLMRTKANCPGQFYGAIAESWIHFEKGLGREGGQLWNAVQKVQTCYTSARMRPGVLTAIDAISKKTGGVVPTNAPTGCPL